MKMKEKKGIGQTKRRKERSGKRKCEKSIYDIDVECVKEKKAGKAESCWEMERKCLNIFLWPQITNIPIKVLPVVQHVTPSSLRTLLRKKAGTALLLRQGDIRSLECVWLLTLFLFRCPCCGDDSVKVRIKR